MKDIYRVLRKGVVTEKSTRLKDGPQAKEGKEQEKEKDKEPLRKYTFVVDLKANKIEIRQAVEKIFDLKNKVVSVRTAVFQGKFRRKGRKGGYRPDWKKAVVTVQKGVTIKAFDEG